MRILFFIVSVFFFTASSAQEALLQSPDVETESVSAVELLKKAQSLKKLSPNESADLAQKALLLSQNNNDQPQIAQAHMLLGTLSQKLNKSEASLHHFLQAALVYKKIRDTRNQIIASIDYVKVLFIEQRYEEADKFIDALIPLTLEDENEWLIALTLTAKSDSYYQQKRYNEAIEQYTQALKYLSSADKVIHKLQGETYKKIAQSYKRLNNREQTNYFYEKTLAVYTDLKNKKLMARTLNTIAESERYLGNLVVALDYSIRGLELHKEIDDPEGRAKAFVGAGVIYRHIGRYKKSLNHIYEAHLYYKKINDANNIAKTANQLGFIYSHLKEFEQARGFYQLSINLSQSIEHQTLASALREMAVLDLNAGNYKTAMQMAQKAYQINQNENDQSKGSIAARVIANIYHAQNNNEKAITYNREALRLAKDSGNIIYQIKAKISLASILIGRNTEESIRHLTKALALSTEINNKEQTLYIYRKFREAEKSRGNIAESLRYAEAEFALLEVIENEKENNNHVLAEANYYSRKMEIEIASLKEKNRLDQLELSKKNNAIEIANQTRKITELELVKNQYASVTLALLLGLSVLVVCFIYRRFRVSKKRNRELDYLAARDPLTNCYNRRFLFSRMDQDFIDTALLDEYCIIMADIDHFKAVNDTYGHSAGDSVIRGVAHILQSCVRQNDIVSRFGGEEFCIVLHRVSQNQAMHIADNMRKKVESTRFGDIAVTSSFGVTSIEFNASSPVELIEQADLALYKSKSLGRNQVTLWDQSFHNKN